MRVKQRVEVASRIPEMLYLVSPAKRQRRAEHGAEPAGSRLSTVAGQARERSSSRRDEVRCVGGTVTCSVELQLGWRCEGVR